MKAVNLAQDKTIELPVDRIKSGVAVLATPGTTAGTAVFVLEVLLFADLGTWNSVGVFDAVAQAKADNITGANQYAWADVPAAQKIRVRRTDATGGDGSVGLDFYLA